MKRRPQSRGARLLGMYLQDIWGNQAGALAEELGVTETYLRGLITGHHRPDYELAAAIEDMTRAHGPDWPEPIGLRSWVDE